MAVVRFVGFNIKVLLTPPALGNTVVGAQSLTMTSMRS